ITEVIALADPIGEVITMSDRPNGLTIGKKRVPLGVIGIIYEARPNVTVDAAVLCLKSGNACILRGGKEAINSNSVLVDIMREALASSGLPEDCICLVRDTSRESAKELMGLRAYVDVLIPRGGSGLIKSVVDNASVPVIETGSGNCHVYVDDEADLEMAAAIVENAKVRTLKKELSSQLRAVMVIPDRPMSTAHSRTLLPKSYLMKNVVYNLSRASLMSAAFFSENWDVLRAASKDCMHEHRRMRQLRELFDVREVALQNGALMSTLSGSGSSFFSLVKQENAAKVAQALKNRFESFRVEIFELDNGGFQILQS
ncbi:MAG: aldehyde dehydrogenase family protein, partial [Epsilonproteobacteria bacterium]|nr:aldehyde dehydrogenase family protein [Campylobacterota bacterium]